MKEDLSYLVPRMALYCNVLSEAIVVGGVPSKRGPYLGPEGH